MKSNTSKKMLPLQLLTAKYEKLAELAASEKLSISQTVREILDKALCLKDGRASLQEILTVLGQGDKQSPTPPTRPLRTSVLKR